MKELIQKFYTGLKNQDASTMISCYHKDVIFQDPAFGKLKGDSARKMWKMLCENGKNLEIDFYDVSANDNKGSAVWEAKYEFSKTKRKVHNIIQAQFEFKDDKIIKHTDHFDLHSWASQALGWKGRLLGGTSFFKQKIQAQTNKALANFIPKS